MPLLGSPTSQPLASSKFITQVADALMPILCSMEPQRTPLRVPRLPSAFGRNFGTRNRLMPCVPAGASGQARQHQMDDVLGEVMLARRDEDLGAGDLVAAVGRGSARVRTRPRSVPHWGSVRHMVPAHVPSSELRQIELPSVRRSAARLRSRHRRPASGPGYMPKERLAEQIISSTSEARRLRQALAAIVGARRRAPVQPPSRKSL